LGFSFNKRLTSKEKDKLKMFRYLLMEVDGKPINIEKRGRCRNIIVCCCECAYIRNIRLVDYLHLETNLCKSCVKKGSRNIAKLDYIRDKIKNADKDLSYMTPEWRKKFSEKRKKYGNPMYGKKDSYETRKKKRLAAIKNILSHIKNGGQLTPNYNPNACKLIDEYGKQHNYNFQHAENGGEYHIKELGYWVDGYDKEKNVVIEIDEDHHFDIDGNILSRDSKRQTEIMNFLECKFIRLKYRGI